MSDESFKVQWSVSLPPAAQYAKGHMLNLRGTSVEEVEEQFDAVLAEGGSFIEKATQVAALLVAAQVVSDGFASDGKKPDNPAQDQQDSGTGNVVGQGRFCPHGKRTRREGNGKRGPWVGYFCPLPRGDANQCAAEFEDA